MTATLPEPTKVTTATRLPAAAIAATRVVVAFLFACHGAQKLFGFFGGVDGAGGTVDFPTWPGYWAAIIELVAGLLVGLGLFTRVAALLCSGAMAYAYFVVHQPIALLPIANNGELAALFSWIFLLIAVLGPGALAVDNLRRR